MTICLMHWQINNGENCYSLSQKKVRKLTHQLTLIHHLTLFHPMK